MVNIGGFDIGIGTGFLKYWWVIVALVVVVCIVAVLWWFSKYRQKNSQWTHKLNVLIEQPNGDIDMDKPQIFKMRRWKHKDETTAPLFELEKPLIGSRIFVELEQYSGPVSYTVVLGNDGRLYLPKRTVMSKDKNALEVSVKHAGIDRTRQSYNNTFEKMNATPGKIDTLKLIKYGIYASALIILLILGMSAIKAWGEKSSHEAAKAQAELQNAQAWKEVMEVVESVMNTQALIIPDLKDNYGPNLQGAIKSELEKLNQS